jgi:quinol monooxygenase YgiN
MIVRIVKMEFQEDKVTDFLHLFEERKERIRHFEGCNHLELWRQSGKSNIFFTYSHWNAESDLNHYRFSDFFKETWQLTKAMFATKAEAWSVEQEVVME